LTLPPPSCVITIDHLAADLGKLFDEFAPTGRLILAGHSLGGMTIMALAEQRPDTLTQSARRRRPIIETQVVRRFLFGEARRREDEALTVDCLLNTPAPSLTGFFEDIVRHHVRYDALGSLAVAPVHVLVGERDKLTPVRHARAISAGINGSRLTIAPGAGHMLPLERDSLVSEALLELVRAAHAAPAVSPVRLAIAR